MNTLNYCNNIKNCNCHLVLHGKSVFEQSVYAFQLKKRKVQNLESDIFRDVYENASHSLKYNESGHDGEKVHLKA